MKAWIHRLTKMTEDGTETIYIPDTEFRANWEKGDPAGYRNKDAYKDWAPYRMMIPDDLHPAFSADDKIILMPEGPAGRKIFLGDVIAESESGGPSVKIGDAEWKLEIVE